MINRIKRTVRLGKSDYIFKTIFSSGMSFIVGIGFTLYNGIIGFVNRSLWNGSVCVYYLLLAVIRGVPVLTQINERRKNLPPDEKRHRRIYFGTHWILIFMNLAMFVPAALMVTDRRSYEYGLIPAIAMATYTSYRITTSIIHFKKSRKNTNLLTAELRTVNMIDSLAAVLTLQNTMINANGGMNHNMRILSAYSSLGILVAMAAITAASFLRLRKK